jgi:hypothetical protein
MVKIIIPLLILLYGCGSGVSGSTGGGNDGRTFNTGTSTIRAEYIVYYASYAEVRDAYRAYGDGSMDPNQVTAFYDCNTRTIFCKKWDFQNCGHELFHAIDGLVIEEHFEHFAEDACD